MRVLVMGASGKTGHHGDGVRARPLTTDGSRTAAVRCQGRRAQQTTCDARSQGRTPCQHTRRQGQGRHDPPLTGKPSDGVMEASTAALIGLPVRPASVAS